MLISPAATSVTFSHLFLFILTKLTLRFLRLVVEKSQVFLIQKLCGFAVRKKKKAARIVLAGERISILALRQFDVNCARELDVLCNFAFQG